MEYEEITEKHAKQMEHLLYELGTEQTRDLLREIIYLQSPLNTERYVYPEVLIKDLARKIPEFHSGHFFYFVDKYHAKSNPLYHKVGFYSDKWYDLIFEKVKNPFDWIEEKVRFRNRDFPVTEEEIRDEIREQKMSYTIEGRVLEKIHMSCVYIFKAQVKGRYLYKIGKTIDLRSRSNTLKREYQYDLYLVNALNCDNPSEIEREIHIEWYENRRFLKRLDGSLSHEWFDLNRDELEEIKEKYNMYNVL